MKKILITGAGGSPATNFIRSLRYLKEKIFIVGTDCDKYYLHRSEADINYLSPSCTDNRYFDFLNYIIEKHGLEFLHIQNDLEMSVISQHREKLHIKTFLPAKETIAICMNKFESTKRWEDAGITVPKTYLLKNEKDLKRIFERFDGRIWLREITGAGGRGSIVPKSYHQAKIWIDFKEGWGKFTAAELLTPNSITWMSIWKDGQLVVAQGRKRLYWELAKLAPSGISGATGGGMTMSDTQLDVISMKAIQAIDTRPHGIFSVDLTYDMKGIPNPTEINIGRFFTTHEFFTRAGLNMPAIFLKLVYGEKLPALKKKINPLKDGYVWIRGIDFLPVFTSMNTIDKKQKEMEQILDTIKT